MKNYIFNNQFAQSKHNLNALLFLEKGKGLRLFEKMIITESQETFATHNPQVTLRLTFVESAENNPSKASDVYIYPVPSSNLLTIKLNNEQVTNTPFKIYNLLGKQIYNGNIIGNQIDLNLKGICSSNGMFIIEILLSNGKINTKKFIYEGY